LKGTLFIWPKNTGKAFAFVDAPDDTGENVLTTILDKIRIFRYHRRRVISAERLHAGIKIEN
jgi:hypothetical protein